MDARSERAKSNESVGPPPKATSMVSGQSSEDRSSRLSGTSQTSQNRNAPVSTHHSGLRLDTLGTMSIVPSEEKTGQSCNTSRHGDATPVEEAARSRRSASPVEEEVVHHLSAEDCRQLAQQLSEAVREELREVLRQELAREDLIQALKEEFEHCARRLQECVALPTLDSGLYSRPPSRSTTRSGWPEAVRRASSTSTSSDPSRTGLANPPLWRTSCTSNSSRNEDVGGSGAQGSGEQDPCELLIKSLKEGSAAFSFSPRYITTSAPKEDGADVVARPADALATAEGARPQPPPTTPPALGPAAAALPWQAGRLSAFEFSSDPSSGGCRRKALSAESALSGTRKACLIGVNPSSRGQAWGQKPLRKLRRRECRELADLERTLASELFRANNLFPEGENDGPKNAGSSSKFLLDPKLPSFCGTRQTSKTSSSKKSKASSSESAKPEQEASAASPSVQKAAWASAVPGAQDRHQRQAWLCGNSDGSIDCGDDAASNVDQESPACPSSSFVAGSVRSVAEAAAQESEPPKADSGISEELLPEVLTGQRARRPSLRPVRVPTCQSLLRQRQDQELKETLQLGAEMDKSEALAATWESEAPSATTMLLRTSMGRLAALASPALGLMPWSSRYLWTSTLYQWAVLGLITSGLVHCCQATYEEYSKGESVTAVVSAMDSILATGALLGLLSVGAFWRSATLRRCTHMLRAYAIKAGALFHWEEVSWLDFAFAVSLWFLSVLLRAGETLLYLERPTLDLAYFSLSAAVLIGISSFLIHTCRCLTKLTDTFCGNVVEQPDFSEVVQEWSLLQSLSRAVCESIQRGFLALQATMTAAVLLSIMQVDRSDISRLLSLVPGLVVALAVIRTSVWAAAVTDKCARVPMLVNSLSVGNVLDPERMYCVQHIVHTQAGFYIFELRLTSSTIIKTIYVACAVAFGLATQVLR